MKKITQSQAEKILKEGEIPEGTKINSVPFVLCGEIDTRPQELKKIKPFLEHQPIPGSLSHIGREVLKLIFNCFERKGHVSEGLIGDVMFGFEAAGVPPELTLAGLKDLQKEGFVDFQAKDGSFITMESDKITSAWVRYKKKLLDLVYS